jgi:hypothetical protein
MLPTLDEQFQLVKRGYTLVVQEMSGSEQQQFLCHAVAGKRTNKRLSQSPFPVRWLIRQLSLWGLAQIFSHR